MLVSQKLEQLAHTFDDSRGVVARYLLKQGEAACRLPLADVAAATNTSKPTLVRIAQQLGYPGWRTLADAYRDELIRRSEHIIDIDHSVPFTSGTSESEILGDLCRLHEEAARMTSEMQDPAELRRAVTLLAGARKIALLGVGTNEHLLRLFQRKCTLIGIDAQVLPQADEGLIICTMTERDCAIMVSYTGEGRNRSPMKRIPLLRAQNIPLIAITNEGDSYLRSNADATLTILSNESLFAKIGTFSTEESISCLLDTLYGCLFARDYERNLAFKVQNARKTESNRLIEET